MQYYLSISGAFDFISFRTVWLSAVAVGNSYSRYISASGGVGTLHGTVSSGQVPPGMTVQFTEGTFFQAVVTGTPTTAGSYDFTLRLTDDATPANVASQSYTLLVNDPLQLTAFSISPLTAGQQYTQQAQATGGLPPYRWSIASSTFSVVSVDQYTGMVTLKPTLPGDYTFDLSVSDTGTPVRTITQRVPVTVNPAPLAFQTTSLDSMIVGSTYTRSIQVSGGLGVLNGTISGQLPPGMAYGYSASASVYTGFLSGTPTAVGSYTFTLQVSDHSTPSNVVTRSFTVVVEAATPQIDSFDIPISVTVGQTYHIQAYASGGIKPYKWSIGTHTLNNVSIDSATGMVTITPVAVGNYVFQIWVSDSGTPVHSFIEQVGTTVNPAP
jgi:hypothetical protein